MCDECVTNRASELAIIDLDKSLAGSDQLLWRQAVPEESFNRQVATFSAIAKSFTRLKRG
jgi:hypothetical protein